MKVATSATIFTDPVGIRLSLTYSVVDETTGKIIEDNKRANKVVTEADAKELANQLLSYAQSYAETITE